MDIERSNLRHGARNRIVVARRRLSEQKPTMEESPTANDNRVLRGKDPGPNACTLRDIKRVEDRIGYPPSIGVSPR
jgi:hypothetical protein